MGEKGAEYFAAAQGTAKSRDELKAEIQDLRERADLSDEEMKSVLESI